MNANPNSQPDAYTGDSDPGRQAVTAQNQSAYQHHTIWTPEMVEFNIPLAGVTRRFMARILDEFLLLAFIIGVWYMIFVIAVLAFAVLSSELSFIKNLADEFKVVFMVGMALITLLIKYLYFVFFHTWNNGQTPGKMACNIRVVTDQIHAVNLWTSMIRAFIDFIDFMLFFGALSLLMMLVNKQEKRLADLAAGTIVILNQDEGASAA